MRRGRDTDYMTKDEFMYQPEDDPTFFDLYVEKKHVEHLSKKNMSKENRLQVIYRILKDQLRNAKK